MKALKWLIILLFIFSGLAYLYLTGYEDSKVIRITDFSREQTYQLQTSEEPSFTNQINVVKSHLAIKGEVSDSVTISGGNCGGTFIGKIDTVISSDWYSPSAELSVIPKAKVDGHLKIVFTFGKI